jgi:N utilization substance protein A
VREVIVDDAERQATVIVPDDQLSLAIGRDGQNARLAARLTGWRVDIKSETEFAQDEEEIEYEGEEQSDGHCMAVLANGRRCPNAAIGGSSYCGLPAHQALSRFETNQIAVLAPLAESEIEILADPDADEGQVTEIVAKADAEFVEDAPEETGTEEVAEETPAAPGSEAEESEDQDDAAAPAGPVEEEDSSSSQAAGEEPTPTPPAGEAEEAEPPADETAQDPQDVSSGEAEGPAEDAESPEDESEAVEEPVAEEAEQT